MAIIDVADQYFALEARIASFQTAQPLAKRTSNAHSKAPKSLKWPHKFLSGEELAKAGFFYYPSQANPDNVACFLCHTSLDGWEKGDDPLVEHLTHSPECGWAIVASINAQHEQFSKMNPASSKMIEARKATFGNLWPHESKKGWKCKTKQMVDAGWKFTPTLEYDDMTTCTYCDLALDGWEPSDKPLEEHFARSPDCAFFTLINEPHSPEGKKPKGRKGRPSKASRASTQSALTVASDAPSFLEMPAEEDDSILTTATTATSQGRKGTKGKKTATGRGRKPKAKKEESVEVMPEPEDNDAEVNAEPTPPRANRGKKRKSLEIDDAEPPAEVEPPQRKRRNTRTRGSVAADSSILEETIAEVKKPGPKKGRGSIRKSSRKNSTASVASSVPFEDELPNDDEIDKALLADLDRPLSDDEEKVAPDVPSKKPARKGKAAKASHAMFSTESVEINENVIDAELEELEAVVRPLPPLPKAKGAKGKQPRKVSAKQEAAAKKAAEAEAAARAAQEEEEEASRQISNELEHSISVDHSSPVVVPKGRRAGSRQPSRQLPARRTRASVLSANSNLSMNDVSSATVTQAVDDSMHDVSNGTVIQTKDDSEDEIDRSHSTVARGEEALEGSTPTKPKEVVSDPEETNDDPEILRMDEDTSKVAVDEEITQPSDRHDIAEEIETEKVEKIVEIEIVEEVQVKTPVKAPKPRGRPPKAAAVTISQDVIPSVPSPSPARTRTPNLPRPKSTKIQTPRAPSPTPPPKDATPAESPQSSDAENHPPSSKPSATAPKATFATPGHTTKVPLAASTPQTSPSRRNVIAGLQSEEPWTAVDLDLVFLKSPTNENGQRRGLLDDALEKAKTGDLTSPEKRMSLEEWIQFNASSAEEKFREDCERMVGTFEREGGRAMRALEGVLVEEN